MNEVDEAVASLEALGVRVDRPALAAVLAAKKSPFVTDVALAWACAAGDERAARHFEARYVPQARRALTKLGFEGTLQDDVVSWLRGELFGRDRGSLFMGYSGKSPLEGWLRAIVVNEAMRKQKQRGRDVTPEAAAEIPVPEARLNALRGAYGKEFTAAIKESFAALTVEQRNLLRQSFLDGLSIDALARLYGVHRATVARRIVAAKEALSSGVKARLKQVLGLGSSGVEQVVTLENLEESLSAVLRRTQR